MIKSHKKEKKYWEKTNQRIKKKSEKKRYCEEGDQKLLWKD